MTAEEFWREQELVRDLIENSLLQNDVEDTLRVVDSRFTGISPGDFDLTQTILRRIVDTCEGKTLWRALLRLKDKTSAAMSTLEKLEKLNVTQAV